MIQPVMHTASPNKDNTIFHKKVINQTSVLSQSAFSCAIASIARFFQPAGNRLLFIRFSSALAKEVD